MGYILRYNKINKYPLKWQFLASINLPQDLHYIYKYVSHIGPKKIQNSAVTNILIICEIYKNFFTLLQILSGSFRWAIPICIFHFAYFKPLLCMYFLATPLPPPLMYNTVLFLGIYIYILWNPLSE